MLFSGNSKMIGDIIFVRSKSPLSWIIRKLTKSNWSHVGVIVSEHYLIESNFFRPVKVRKNRYKDFRIIQLNITDKERLNLISFLLDQTNRDYDYGRILGILLYILGFSKNRHLWNNYNKDICSELVLRGLLELPEMSFLNDSITPEDIIEGLDKANKSRISLEKQA
ncbi:hypothetical protein BC351_00245 [Paenibacillus ferrarius]|uniref:Permuted papain-like amidase YaeF/Yiix C92 family enzyme n=2 Tax=Paenibacillus ferrarius TaxID=1469647 RepID=A0A1V4HS37_9BACL|nr:hypothetical protein BC351_00245 [Paenibacillus ferrarius]